MALPRYSYIVRFQTVSDVTLNAAVILVTWYICNKRQHLALYYSSAVQQYHWNTILPCEVSKISRHIHRPLPSPLAPTHWYVPGISYVSGILEPHNCVKYRKYYVTPCSLIRSNQQPRISGVPSTAVLIFYILYFQALHIFTIYWYMT